MKKVVIAGANGRMGKIAQIAVGSCNGFECTALITRQDDYKKVLENSKADILIDLTSPEVVFEHTYTALELGICPIIGTSGLTTEEIKILQGKSRQNNTGGIIAPNFSISAILMQRFAAIAAKYYKHVNIIEQHHPNKKDAPSGTAVRTAEIIAREKDVQYSHESQEIIPGALGSELYGVNIQSIRRPGIIAQQTVIFSDINESLSITQESYSRDAFIAGIQLACNYVLQIKELLYGLEQAI